MVLAAFNLLWRLGWADLHFDEPLYGRDGWHAIHARAPVADHPMFGKLLIGLGQVLVGRNPVGMRILPVLVALAGTFAAYGLGRRVSRWTGVIAAALWATLGRDLVVAGHSTISTRIDRYGLLDTIAAPLQLGAIWAALWWGDRPSSRRAALVGLLVGLATATKLSAAVVVPVVAVALLASGAPRAEAVRSSLLAAAVAVVAFVATYAPFGRDAPRLFRGAIDFQLDHADLGHTQVIGDQVYVREPWWANLRFWWDADGLMVLVILVAALAAWWARDRLLVVCLWLTVLVTFGFLAVSPVAIPHYRVQWMGPLMVLAAAGITSLWARAEVAPRVLAVVLGLALGWAGLVATVEVAGTERGPYQQMAADVRASGHQPDRAITFGTDVAAYLPGTTTTFGGFASDKATPQLLVIDRQFALSQITSAKIDALRANARAAGLTRRVHGDLEYWYQP